MNNRTTCLIGVLLPRKMKSSSGFLFLVPLEGRGRKSCGVSVSRYAFFAMLLINILVRCEISQLRFQSQHQQRCLLSNQAETINSFAVLSGTSCRPGFSKTTWRVSQLKPCKALMPFLSSAWLCGLTVTSWCKAFFGGPIGSHLAVRSAGNGFFRTGIFGKAKSGHKLRRRMYSVTGTQGWVLIECNHI